MLAKNIEFQLCLQAFGNRFMNGWDNGETLAFSPWRRSEFRVFLTNCMCSNVVTIFVFRYPLLSCIIRFNALAVLSGVNDTTILCPSCRFRVFKWRAPRPSAQNISVLSTLPISSVNGAETFLRMRKWHERNICLNTALALRLGRLVGYPLQQLRQKSKSLQVLHHGWVWFPKRFPKQTGCLLREIASQLAQLLIMEPRWATCPKESFDHGISGAKESEPILCRALRDGVHA